MVQVSKMVAWISAIPLTDWPQQRSLADGQVRPSMVTDLDWHDFAKIARPIVDDLCIDCNGRTYQWMLSAVMPGHSIEPHVDLQPDYWLYRIHVPLITNPESLFIVGGIHCAMQVGTAYLVNTMAMHSVVNNGSAPRIHFMFDVRADA